MKHQWDAHLPFQGLEPGWGYTTQSATHDEGDAGCLPSHRASSVIAWYKIILLGDREVLVPSPKPLDESGTAKCWTHDLLTASPTLLCHHADSLFNRALPDCQCRIFLQAGCCAWCPTGSTYWRCITDKLVLWCRISQYYHVPYLVNVAVSRSVEKLVQSWHKDWDLWNVCAAVLSQTVSCRLVSTNQYLHNVYRKSFIQCFGTACRVSGRTCGLQKISLQ